MTEVGCGGAESAITRSHDGSGVGEKRVHRVHKGPQGSTEIMGKEMVCVPEVDIGRVRLAKTDGGTTTISKPVPRD